VVHPHLDGVLELGERQLREWGVTGSEWRKREGHCRERKRKRQMNNDHMGKRTKSPVNKTFEKLMNKS
jgi:hypothetical protein